MIRKQVHNTISRSRLFHANDRHKSVIAVSNIIYAHVSITGDDHEIVFYIDRNKIDANFLVYNSKSDRNADYAHLVQLMDTCDD